MEGFTYKDGQLYADDVAIEEIARELGTPTYVYSASAIRAAYHRLERAFAPLGAKLHYAVKASNNLHLCRLLRGLGAGMDVVSGGELERAWLAGTPMSEIAFAGVGKTEAEVRAALDGRFSLLGDDATGFGRETPVGRGPVGHFNVESTSELERLGRIATELGVDAHVLIRTNPDVDARTHEYTTTGREENKFGVPRADVPGLFAAWADHPRVRLVGLHVHIGSPVREIEPYAQAAERLLELAAEIEAQGQRVGMLDFGGGWPIDYRDGEVPPVEAFAERLLPLLAPAVARGLRIMLEPGRSILGNSGVLVTRVQHVKHGRAKTFVVCDAGMHTLIRPALYQAFHFIWPARFDGPVPPRAERPDLPGLVDCDVVGPICESGDFLARRRPLPPVEQDDLLAVFSAGAYGMSMSSSYNDHPRPAEVLVDGDRATVIRERQSLAALLDGERHTRDLPLPG